MNFHNLSVADLDAALKSAASAKRPHAAHAALRAKVQERAPAGLTLVSGFEIQLDLPNADLTDPRLHLAGSTAALVEFAGMTVPPNSARELYRIRMSGVVPVLAHPERYSGATLELVEAWRGSGAVMQVSAALLFGRASVCRLARALLQRGFADILASDNHGDPRSLGAARRWLEELGASEQARALTEDNPRRLLASAGVLSVDPIPEADAGMLARLRGLLTRRP